MSKKNKNIIWILFALAILIVSCRPPTAEGEEFSKSGTDGLVMNFLSGAPPSKIYADAPYSNIEVPLSIEVRNKGAYPTDDEDSWSDDSVIFISGYDKSIIRSWELEDKELSDEYPYVSLRDKADVLEGKSINNPDGGYDLLEFIGKIDIGNLDIESYNPAFLVTACYNYKTKASPNVCIDPRPFTTVKERKVCTIRDVSLKNQGAPISITKVEEKALSNSIQFKIHFKNVGGGDVIAIDKLDKCFSISDKKESLEKKDMDFVKIVDVKIGRDRSIKNDCGQLMSIESEKDYARLINGAGFIVCNFKYGERDIETAYTTPLYVELDYGYRSSISKSMGIVKVPESK